MQIIYLHYTWNMHRFYDTFMVLFCCCFTFIILKIVGSTLFNISPFVFHRIRKLYSFTVFCLQMLATFSWESLLRNIATKTKHMQPNTGIQDQYCCSLAEAILLFPFSHHSLITKQLKQKEMHVKMCVWLFIC